MSHRSEERPIPRRPSRSFLWLSGMLLLLAVGLGYRYVTTLQDAPMRLKTVVVERGTIARVVTATGTLEPVLSVEVGSEVSGTIMSLHADFNSTVRAGDIIAKIDPAPFQAGLEQEQASLLSAKARLAQARAELSLKRRDVIRAHALLAKGFVSQARLDVDRTAFESAVAQVDLNQALVDQATAALAAAQFNLDHTVIYSPVDGTVIDRKINAGQTVAASFQTPALFIIAEDLTRMRVIAHVGEADIAKVAERQETKFRVDAYPNVEFHGTVTQVRLASKQDQNVVTYDVAIDVANPDLLLKPGMTADVEIVVKSVRDILTVPNVALRFTPPTHADMNTQTSQEAIAKPPPNHRTVGAPDSEPEGAPATVWIPGVDGVPTPLVIGTGVADDRFTAVTEGALQAGDLVIVGIESDSAEGAGRALPPWFR